MKFKKFLELKEDQGSDRGLMGYGTPYKGRKPSDGLMSQNAGQQMPMAQDIKMMKKKMKKN